MCNGEIAQGAKMKNILLLGVSALLMASCQQSSEKTTTLSADASICDRYFAFVEGYADKQQKPVKDALLSRLDYDKKSLPARDKQEADAYCKSSLARMERMAG
jgi:hypothetical protein